MKSDTPTASRKIEQARDTGRDEQLAKLITELLEEQRRGQQQPNLDRVARQHPELADELRELWAAALIADELGRSSASSTPTPGWQPVPWETGVRVESTSASGPRTMGDFELLEELGRGGMGVVYRAWQISLDRIVALKMILSGEMASAADMARFRAEAESAARLDHPNIVPVYTVSEDEGRPYFTMKWVAGTTLARRLADGPLPPREAAAILAPVARSIHFAHQHGVLHRDLKPSNILLELGACEFTPFVTDFGLAKRIDVEASLTLSGAILGTPSYMPPEQAAGNRGQLGPASDVYSLGAILYQMLTGRPPFQAATPVDVVLQVLEQDPLPPRLVNPQADRELEMIALKCLQKPPDLRYTTALALAHDLESYLAGEPISARSGTIGSLLNRLFRETHHAAVLENWGLLWMWHSLVLIVLCVATNVLQWQAVSMRTPYVVIWTLGLGTWAYVFWWLRQRGGPVTFVERQIAHVWGASMAASALLFGVEALLDLPVLKLSPVLALIGGMGFVVKGGILSGTFYFQAAAMFVTAGWMAVSPHIALTLYGFVSAACFFLPGLKYHWQRTRTKQTQP